MVLGRLVCPPGGWSMPTLIFRDTDGSKHTYVLKEELTVGRDVANDVVLKDPNVSKRHCRFFLDDDDRVWVEDSRSSNGVQVNGVRIEEAVRIDANAKVCIGDCTVSHHFPALSSPMVNSPVESAVAGRPAE